MESDSCGGVELMIKLIGEEVARDMHTSTLEWLWGRLRLDERIRAGLIVSAELVSRGEPVPRCQLFDTVKLTAEFAREESRCTGADP